MYHIPLDRGEVEEALTELGYRYHPDPMGWIDQGSWRSDHGEAIAGAELDDFVGVPTPVADKPRGMRNRKVRKKAKQGREADRRVKKLATEKEWKPNPKIHQKGFSNRFPDLRSRRGNYFELKPDSESGRKEAKRKVKIYNEALRDAGENKKVKPIHHRRTFGGGFRLRPSFGRLKPFWLRNLWLP